MRNLSVSSALVKNTDYYNYMESCNKLCKVIAIILINIEFLLSISDFLIQ